MAAILRATVVAACLSSVLSFALNSAPILGQRCSTAGAACVSRPGLRAAVVQRNRAGGPRDPIRAGAGGVQMQFGFGNLFNKKVTLQDSGIVPDIIPEMFTEKTVIRIKYPAWVKASVDLTITSLGDVMKAIKYPAWVKASVDLTSITSFGGTPTRGVGEISQGQVVSPTQVQDQPVLGWEAEEGMYYTLVMVDPDAPTAIDPKLREWVHWVRVNIPGDNLPCDGKDGGDNLKEYVGAGPPKDTGEHRYVFLLFEQADGKQDFSEKERIPFVASGREKWSAATFAAENNLGAPIAWAFFKASYDTYVPELYAKLRGQIA